MLNGLIFCFLLISKRKWPLFRRQIWTWKISPRPPCHKVLIKRNNFLKLVYPVLFRGFQLFPVFTSGFWSVNGFTVFFCGFPLYSCVSQWFLIVFQWIWSVTQYSQTFPNFIEYGHWFSFLFKYRFRSDLIPISMTISYRFSYRFHTDSDTDFIPISYRYRIRTDTDSDTDFIPISIPIARFLGHKNTDTEPNSKSHTVSSLILTLLSLSTIQNKHEHSVSLNFSTTYTCISSN